MSSFPLRCFLLNLQSDSPSVIKSGVPGLPDSSRAQANGNSFCGLLSCPSLMVWRPGLVILLRGRAETLSVSQKLSLMIHCVFCSSNKIMSRQTNRCDIKKHALQGMFSQCLMKEEAAPLAPERVFSNIESSTSLGSSAGPLLPTGVVCTPGELSSP